MGDPNRLRICQLNQKSDYAFWRIRVKAIIGAKGNNDAIDVDRSERASIDNKINATNIIISTLGDQQLRFVRTVVGELIDRLIKLDTRYDSKPTATPIAKLSELVYSRYGSWREKMSAHREKMAAVIKQPR